MLGGARPCTEDRKGPIDEFYRSESRKKEFRKKESHKVAVRCRCVDGLCRSRSRYRSGQA